MTYKLIKDRMTGAEDIVVKRTTDNAFIPFDENNTDYIKIQEWASEGNTIEAADVTLTWQDIRDTRDTIGTFETRIQKKRISLNPKTLEKVEVPEKKSIIYMQTNSFNLAFTPQCLSIFKRL